MKKILVAEDEFDLLRALQSILEGEGYRVIACKDGREAMDKLGDTHPDLVVADCMMPHLSGPSLVNNMQQNEDLREVPVILISCAGRPSDLNASNVKAFLRKPFSLEELLEHIERVVEGAA